MFGGDPFGDPFKQMHRQMQQMDNMMNQMMGDPFGGMFGSIMGNRNQMITNGNQQNNPANMMMSPFGGGLFGGLMQQMSNFQHNAINDPNSTVFTQSTMISYNGNGEPHVIQSSTRKAGDVKETRHSVQKGEEHKLSIGHSIGDRTHIIEKKRDRDGRVRQKQKFINLDEDEAEDFNTEFKTRASRNISSQFGGYGNNIRNGIHGRQQQAIQAPSGSSKINRRNVTDSTPIVTVPDDDEDDYKFKKNSKSKKKNYSSVMIQNVEDDDDDDDNDDDNEYIYSNNENGPTICEISDEETADTNNPKRRKGLIGKFFGH